MKFLLDTNVIVALAKRQQQVIDHLRQHRPSDCGLPAAVMHELYFGACRSARRGENLARIESLPFGFVALEREDARVAAQLRAQLRDIGQPIGPFDVLIAGQALARDLTLVTHNTREFARVPGLRIEDWQ